MHALRMLVHPKSRIRAKSSTEENNEQITYSDKYRIKAIAASNSKTGAHHTTNPNQTHTQKNIIYNIIIKYSELWWQSVLMFNGIVENCKQQKRRKASPSFSVCERNTMGIMNEWKTGVLQLNNWFKCESVCLFVCPLFVQPFQNRSFYNIKKTTRPENDRITLIACRHHLLSHRWNGATITDCFLSRSSRKNLLLNFITSVLKRSCFLRENMNFFASLVERASLALRFMQKWKFSSLLKIPKSFSLYSIFASFYYVNTLLSTSLKKKKNKKISFAVH